MKKTKIVRQQTIERHNLIRAAVAKEWKKNPDASAAKVYREVSVKTGYSEWTIRDIANKPIKRKE